MFPMRGFGGWVALAALALALGCPASDDGGDGSNAAPTTVADSGPSPTSDTSDDSTPVTGGADATSAGTGGTSGSTAAVDGTGEAIKFDLGLLPDAPMLEMGCSKVDFLFVIDNSGSMSAQQTQLLASFQGFIDAIQASLQDSVDSYHVGVITSDAYSSNAPGCNVLGGLVTQTQAGGNCAPFAEGGRYATDMDDLSAKFPCMANVGAFGSGTELPVTATIAAFDPAMSQPGACNEGFLRDDAILVLVVLTDDPPYDGTMDDAHPMAMTAGWHDAIVAAKNGDPEAMVVIGFVPWTDVTCVVFNIESPNLIDFVQSFGEQGVIASICEPDFGPVFAQTVETIVTTCENFDPPG
jgi:hypothetical protein